MGNRFGRSLRNKVRLGRIRVPVWTLALTVVLVLAAAGQAVGPVLAGSVTGKAGVVVSQTVVLAGAPADAGAGVSIDGYGNGSIDAVDADDSVGTVNDEGTEFAYALETQVGQTSIINLDLDNQSGVSANFILEIHAPAGLDIDANEGNADVEMAQLNKNTWLGTVAHDPSGTDDILIAVEPKDDAAPGFYTITGRIVQVAN